MLELVEVLLELTELALEVAVDDAELVMLLELLLNFQVARIASLMARLDLRFAAFVLFTDERFAWFTAFVEERLLFINAFAEEMFPPE